MKFNEIVAGGKKGILWRFLNYLVKFETKIWLKPQVVTFIRKGNNSSKCQVSQKEHKRALFKDKQSTQMVAL